MMRTLMLVAVAVSVGLPAGCGPAGGGPVAVLEPVAAPVKPAGVHRVEVRSPAGKVVRFVLSVPADIPAGEKVPLAVALHYSGKDEEYYGEYMVTGLVGPGFAAINPVIVAPDALGDRDDWTSPDNVAHVVWLTKCVLKAYPVDPKKVVLTGYSAGGIGTWHVAPFGTSLFTAAVPVAGRPPADLAGWTLPVYAVHATADQTLAIGPTADAIETLAGRGVNAKLDRLAGVTHQDTGRYAPALGRAAEWLKTVWK